MVRTGQGVHDRRSWLGGQLTSRAQGVAPSARRAASRYCPGSTPVQPAAITDESAARQIFRNAGMPTSARPAPEFLAVSKSARGEVDGLRTCALLARSRSTAGEPVATLADGAASLDLVADAVALEALSAARRVGATDLFRAEGVAAACHGPSRS